MKLKHILRYGTSADQGYFGDFESCYDIIAINASMAAFTPNALAVFVAKRTVDKEFFVDPMTHLFQHNRGFISSAKKMSTNDSSTVPIKKSIANLIDCYAENIDGYQADNTDSNYTLLRDKIRSEEIDNDFYKSFSEGVLDFQDSIVPDDKAREYKEYIDYANDLLSEADKITFQNKPCFFVAPYFYLQASDRWLIKNIALLKAAGELKENVYAQIVLSKRLFDKAVGAELSDFDSIINAYVTAGAPGYLVWVDEFIEHQELSKGLVKYAKALKSLRQNQTKRVHTLYGGYFSTLLGHNDLKILDGVTHGLEYGESRSVIPVGGGIPRAKYYFPKLHKRVDFANMVEVLAEKKIDTKAKFHSEICNCATCQEVIKSDNVLDDFTQFGQTKSTTVKRGERIVTLSFSTKETKDLSLKHYLEAKKTEFGELENKTLAQHIETLRQTAVDYAGVLDGSYSAHLTEWAEALEDLSQE